MKSAALLATDVAAFCALASGVAPVTHGIVSQAVLTAPGLRVTRFSFARGQELSEHTSPARVLVQVIVGSCAFTVGGRTHLLQPGDLLHVPPRLPHALRAVTDLTLIVTQATPPPAEE